MVMNEQDNKPEVKATEFDGKKALIVGAHPYSGSTATCQHAERTAAGWGIKFRRENGDEFYVFDGVNVKWIDL